MAMFLMMCVDIWRESLLLLELGTVRGGILCFLKIRAGRKILLSFRSSFQKVRINIMSTRFLS